MRITLELWLAMAEFPHTEQRGERIAVCTHGLQLAIASLLYDLTDYVVWAVCGPYIELAKRRRTRDLLLPRLLAGQVKLEMEAA